MGIGVFVIIAVRKIAELPVETAIACIVFAGIAIAVLLSPEVGQLIEGDDTVWEQGPLKVLATEDQLRAYRHHGFTSCAKVAGGSSRNSSFPIVKCKTTLRNSSKTVTNRIGKSTNCAD
jgi:hypothetical protein